MELCPCGSQIAYKKCCEPCITGKKPATTAEQLMRSRYTAYTKVATDYIRDTTHPDHRGDYDHEGTETWAREAEWLGLEIIEMIAGGVDDTCGTVEFVACFKEDGHERRHHEIGSFKKDADSWYFTEGAMVTNKPIVRSGPKIGRNDPCPCGSPLKYKKCCGK